MDGPSHPAGPGSRRGRGVRRLPRTADAGDDATALFDDPSLPGHVWAGPYLATEPRLAFVVEDDHGVGGYVLAALDTELFEQRCEAEWWPPLRARYPDPAEVPFHNRTADEHAARRIHRPTPTPTPVTERFPSHLHIDLLPRIQGGGVGRRMMDTVVAALAALGSPAVHLGVNAANEHAIGFYTHLGWQAIDDLGDALLVGRDIDR